MDMWLFFDVLRRYRLLVLAGSALAVLLAVVAYGQPAVSHGVPTIKPRGAEIWQSQSKLLITQQSFPYGRASQQYTKGSSTNGTSEALAGDVTYMSSLAPIYAALANGDQLQALLRRAAPVPGTVKAVDIADAISGTGLPFVQLTSTAATRSDAALLAERAATTLQRYVAQQQSAAGVQPAQRVQLDIVQDGSQAQLVAGHKLTIPLLVFMAVLGATIALAFVLESGRQRGLAADDLAAVSYHPVEGGVEQPGLDDAINAGVVAVQSAAEPEAKPNVRARLQRPQPQTGAHA